MFKTKPTIRHFIDNFPWESKVQKESFLSLMLWLKNMPSGLDLSWGLVAAFMFQKDHESNEWLLGIIGDRVRRLEDEIMMLREEIRQK